MIVGRTAAASTPRTGLISALEAEHFTVVSVRHRHSRLFGGGFPCFTLDAHRDDACEDCLT
ncbi:hypothetical protein [Streptomyces yangpuensis]|uniref:hypothetical protein n=1 Tax=Streptomyces yangpuensis TaxID=1648182 RepID=UPI00365D1BB9